VESERRCRVAAADWGGRGREWRADGTSDGCGRPHLTPLTPTRLRGGRLASRGMAGSRRPSPPNRPSMGALTLLTRAASGAETCSFFCVTELPLLLAQQVVVNALSRERKKYVPLPC